MTAIEQNNELETIQRIASDLRNHASVHHSIHQRLKDAYFKGMRPDQKERMCEKMFHSSFVSDYLRNLARKVDLASELEEAITLLHGHFVDMDVRSQTEPADELSLAENEITCILLTILSNYD